MQHRGRKLAFVNRAIENVCGIIQACLSQGGKQRRYPSSLPNRIEERFVVLTVQPTSLMRLLTRYDAIRYPGEDSPFSSQTTSLLWPAA